MASGNLITDYLSYGSGAPSGAPSLAAAGQVAFYENTATGDLYCWNPTSSAWAQVARGTGPVVIAGTAHEISASLAGSTYTLSTPQAIDTISSVVFASIEAGGIGGSTNLSRYTGAVNGAAPSSGSASQGDWVVDLAGGFWICTAGGSPGTWQQVKGIAPTTPLVGATNKYTGAGIAISSTSLTDIKSTLDITLSTGAHRCIMLAQLSAYSNNGTNCFIDIQVDGTAQGGSNGMFEVDFTGGTPVTINHLTAVLTAGSHTFKLVGKAGSGATLNVLGSGDGVPITFSVIETPFTS